MLIAMADLDNHWSLSNSGRDELLVWLEPWADEFAVPTRSTVVMRPSSGHTLGEIEWTPDHLIVWANAPTVEVSLTACSNILGRQQSLFLKV
jgi:hypothetical protein